MELQQIRYFLAVAKELNFRRAARHCNVAQPSVTNAIKTLERELGGALFCRQRPIRLSELGEAVLPHFARIAHEVENSREAAKAFATPIAATPPIAALDPTSAPASG
jgi:LysR family transcriptional regulator, hydrogen peroxide-inducible genes activator